MADLSPPPASGASIGKLDSAETFAESDVSVTGSKLSVAGESVELGTVTGDTFTVSQSPFDTATGKSGLVINPDTELQGVKATLALLGDFGGGTAYLQDGSTVLDTAPLSNEGSVRLEATLSAGTRYRVLMDEGGDLYETVRNGNETDAGSFTVVDGFEDGSTITGIPYQWTKIEALTDATSATGHVSWDSPPTDLLDWDRAAFTFSPDGETVDVYVEEDQDGGWTEIAGPIASGDGIPADPSNDVRFRVELSRADTANNPTLDSIYRRWVLG